MIDRRTFNAGVLGLSALPAIARAQPSATVVTQSPLFAPQLNEAFVLSGIPSFPSWGHRLEASWRPVLVRLVRHRFADGLPVESIVAAEDRLFAEAPDFEVDDIDDIDAEREMLVFNLVRMGVRIARVSQRGFGNNLLMHQSMFDSLMRSRPVRKSNIVKLVEPVVIGRWKNIAVLNKMSIFVSDTARRNEVIAFYRGSVPTVVDGPIAVIRDAANNLSMLTDSDKILRATFPRQPFI